MMVNTACLTKERGITTPDEVIRDQDDVLACIPTEEARAHAVDRILSNLDTIIESGETLENGRIVITELDDSAQKRDGIVTTLYRAYMQEPRPPKTRADLHSSAYHQLWDTLESKGFEPSIHTVQHRCGTSYDFAKSYLVVRPLSECEEHFSEFLPRKNYNDF